MNMDRFLTRTDRILLNAGNIIRSHGYSEIATVSSSRANVDGNIIRLSSLLRHSSAFIGGGGGSAAKSIISIWVGGLESGGVWSADRICVVPGARFAAASTTDSALPMRRGSSPIFQVAWYCTTG
mgnify:FL=1